MIISHDRKTLFIGVPKNGSQTARAVLGQLGVDLVGEMGRHPKVPEAIRLAEARFPGEVIAPNAIYAFWRDPVERFCSAVEFHKRCLPNSFIRLFPDQFAGLEPHPRWFEKNPETVALDLRTVIDRIGPAEIIAALPPPSVPAAVFHPLGGYLSFYRLQTEWLDRSLITVLPFADYDTCLRSIVDSFGGIGALVEIPQINAAANPLPALTPGNAELVRAYYQKDAQT